MSTRLIIGIDSGIAIYYEDCGRDDYYDEEKSGKFMSFCIANDLDDDDIERELNNDPQDCILLDFDQEFPLINADPNDCDIKTKMFKVLIHFYHLKIPSVNYETQNDEEDKNDDSKHESYANILPQNILKKACIQRMDDALAAYYRAANTDYRDAKTEKGKFVIFCEEKKFNDEDIEREMNGSSVQCLLTEFDPDFPIEPTLQKREIIFKTLKQMYNSAATKMTPYEIQSDKKTFGMFPWLLYEEKIDELINDLIVNSQEMSQLAAAANLLHITIGTNQQSNVWYFSFYEDGHIAWVPYDDEFQIRLERAWINNQHTCIIDKKFQINIYTVPHTNNAVVYGQQCDIQMNNSKRRWVIRSRKDPKTLTFDKKHTDSQKYDLCRTAKCLHDTFPFNEHGYGVSSKVINEIIPAALGRRRYELYEKEDRFLCVNSTEMIPCNPVCNTAISIKNINGSDKYLLSISCPSIKRLIYALKYYHCLDLSKQTGQTKLMKFVHEVYKDILNDYVHLMQKHNGDLDIIYECLMNNKFAECNVGNCRHVIRRSGELVSEFNYKEKYKGQYQYNENKNSFNRNALQQQYKMLQDAKKMIANSYSSDSSDQSDDWATLIFKDEQKVQVHDDMVHDDNDQSQSQLTDIEVLNEEELFFDVSPPIDHKFMFINDLFDGLHCYLLHQYDLGWKINIHSIEYQQAMNNTDTEHKVDSDIANRHFKAMFKVIKKKSQKYRYRQRSSRTKNKFNIEIIANEDSQNMSGDQTFLEEMYKRIKHKNGAKLCDAVKDLCTANEFDSDAVQDDIAEQLNDSKMTSYLKNNVDADCYQTIERYVVECKLSRFEFSTGFTFYYWPYYKTVEQEVEDITNIYNIQDHHGYKQHQLFVKPNHPNIKEELLQNDNITLSQFQSKLVKAESFYSADVVRQSQASSFVAIVLHFNMEPGTKLKVSNLLSVIFYTDLTDLQNIFTKTFRKMHINESLLSLKKRHAKFANWSKLLRETVEGYGVCGDDLQGPFFSGISQVLLMPAFNIRLCGPTSTSLFKEVALRFGGEDGILISLRKVSTFSGDLTQPVRGFCCSWLSDYGEEAEYLFIGGFRPLSICNITKIRTAEVFSDFVQALYVFDSVLSGNPILDQVTQKHHDVLNDLITDAFERTANEYKCHEYMVNSMKRMIASKTHVVLDMYRIDNHVSVLTPLIFHNLCVAGSNPPKCQNLLKSDIIKLFPNLRQIMMISCRANRA
eukprot:174697_1